MKKEKYWWHVFVEAQLYLSNEGEGARNLPVYDGYSPNHKFSENLFLMGFLTEIAGDSIKPGEEKHVKITFVVGEPFQDLFKEGATWKVHEGGNCVGSGVILNVLQKVKATRCE